jgi:hypothetical protein
MTVRVNKSPINIREKLSELEAENDGVVPCFSARATNNGTGATFTTDGLASPYTPIPFDAVDVSRRNCYNGTESKFTCTVSGIYQFNVSLITGGTDHWFRGVILHQSGGIGTPIQIHWSQTDYGGSANTDFQHTGFSCLYPCSVGDKVWVVLSTGQGGTESVYTGESGKWSIFSGHLISV